MVSAAPGNATFVGGGPAGLAPLVWAARQGKLADLVAAGLVVIERGHKIGAGSIGRHAIGSDTLADNFPGMSRQRRGAPAHGLARPPGGAGCGGVSRRLRTAAAGRDLPGGTRRGAVRRYPVRGRTYPDRMRGLAEPAPSGGPLADQAANGLGQGGHRIAPCPAGHRRGARPAMHSILCPSPAGP